jgi:quinohemoprotein ethanol dehydrogenase
MKAKEGHSGQVFGLLAAMLCSMVSLAWAVDPEFDRLQRQSPGTDWLTNGGDLSNQRYSTLKQINTSNVKQLRGAPG